MPTAILRTVHSQKARRPWRTGPAAGVVAIINPGYDLESSKLALVNAGNIEVYALVGIHPHDAKPRTLLRLRSWSASWASREWWG